MTTRYLRGSVIFNEHDPLNRGLVGEWRFDRNAGSMVPDYSGYGAHGVNDGDWVTTEVGLALEFDGNNNVDVPDVPHLNISGNIAVEVFASTSDNGARFITRWGSDQSYTLELGAGRAYFYIRVADVNKRAEQAGVYSDGNWHHYVGWFDGANVQICVDGHEYTLGDATAGPIDTPAQDLAFFSYNHENGRSSGKLALIRIYNRAFSVVEAHARYQMCLRRMQTFGGERRFPVGFVAAEAARRIFITHT